MSGCLRVLSGGAGRTDLQHDHGVVGLGALVSVGRRVLVRIWLRGHRHVVGAGVLYL